MFPQSAGTGGLDMLANTGLLVLLQVKSVQMATHYRYIRFRHKTRLLR